MAVARSAEAWSAWPAPAKLNLFLRIVGRRADGYHQLQTVFQLLDWGDTVWLRPRQDGRIERLAGAAGVAAEQDLCVRAARLLRAEFAVAAGVDIRVDKQIPLGGGFGGGSSDAASTLVGLSRLWRLPATLDQLAELGLRLGADVPVFVRGHSGWGEGVGEQVQPLQLGECWYVLLDSGVHAATGELFQAPELTRNAPSLTMADFAPGLIGENAFTPVLRARSAPLARLLDAISALGTGGLTGSGGGCFLLAESRVDADAKAAQLAELAKVIVARGVDRSSLWDAMASWPS